MRVRSVVRRLRGPATQSPRGLSQLAEAVLGDDRLLVADVGALGGLLPELAPLARQVRAVGFDPDAEECARLNADAEAAGLPHRFLPYAVTGTDGRRSFHVLRKEASSSLLPPNRDYHDRFPESERMDVMRTVEVETRAFGPLLAAEGERAEFLKLDAHGVEGEILDSLLDTQWDDLLGAHMELLLGHHYVGQGTLGSMHDTLRRHGLELYSLKRYSSRRASFDASRHASRGQLAFADGLYLRNPAQLDEAQRRRLAVVAAAFRHYDLAHELLASDLEAARLVLALAKRRRGVPAQPWSSDGPDDWI